MSDPLRQTPPAVDYKDTLNLCQTDFPIRPTPAVEDATILGRWKSHNLAERAMRVHEGAAQWILHDGPPYANGDIHLGHAYNKILKDIIAKSRRMAGMHVPIIPGWDCHGLPIEHKVMGDESLAVREPRAVKAACRAYAEGWIVRQKEAFKQLGVLMDWDNPYITMAPSYEAATLRALQKLVERGFITRKLKTVAWCFHCETTLASAEIEYQERKDPSLYVAFQIAHDPRGDARLKGAAFIAWTTTPWTLPLNRAIALNPQAQYTIVSLAGRTYILGAERVAALSKVLEQEIAIIDTVPGSTFAQMRVHHPFIANLTVPVIFGDHVGTTEGTAVVHTAPGCGPEDYELGVKQGLEIFAPLSSDGRYIAGIQPRELEGMRVADAHGAVIQLLQAAGNLVHKGSIRHSYPHCWRCRHGLIYRATKQWFFELSHDAVQEHAARAANELQFSPRAGSSFLRAAVEHRWEWCLSRQRVWGVPIPALICTQCDHAVLLPAMIERVASHVAREGIEYWDSCTVEEIAKGLRCDQCQGAQWRKERDILDVWFDSGVSHSVVLTAEHGQRYPADMYLEGIDQFRGWFQSSLLTALGIHGTPPMRTIMYHGFTVDDKGRKMSKSLGNVVPPQDLIVRLGVDGLRLWVASIDHGSDAVVSESLLRNVEQVYLKIRNSLRFMLQNVGTFDPDNLLPFNELLYADRMMLVRWIEFHREVRKAYESYDTTALFHATSDMCTTILSAVYFDAIKDRLYTETPDGRERRSAQTVLWRMLDSMVRLLAPVLSLTAEHVADYYRHPWSESVHLQDFADDAWFGVPAEALQSQSIYRESWELMLRVREGVMRALERERELGVMKHSRQAAVTITYTPREGEGARLERMCQSITQSSETPAQVLAELYVVANVALVANVQPEGVNVAPGIACTVQQASGNRCARCWRWRVVSSEGICTRCTEVLAGSPSTP